MEIGEDDLALPHPRPLALDGLLHFDHHLGLGPHVRGLGHERRPRRAIRLVREPRADPGALLHEHAVAVAHQRLDPRRHERHAVFGSLDLFGDTNDHARSTTFLRDVFVLRRCVTSLRLCPAIRPSAAPAQSTPPPPPPVPGPGSDTARRAPKNRPNDTSARTDSPETASAGPGSAASPRRAPPP